MKIMSLLMLLLITVSAVSALTVRFYPGELEGGTSNDVVVTYFNHGTSMRNVNTQAIIPELEAYDRAQLSRIKTDRTAKAHLLLDIPDEAHGYYPLIIKTYDDDGFRSVRHTWVYVNS